MNSLARKLKTLEQNVISDNPDPKETYLGIDNKQEIELLKMAYNIVKNQDQQLKSLEAKQNANPTVDYTKGKRAFLALNDSTEPIVSQASRIMFLRASHIFDSAIASQYHLNDPLGKMLFYSRFFFGFLMK